MSFEIVPLRPFEKQFKRLVRKFPSLKREITSLATELGSNPRMGRSIYDKGEKDTLTDKEIKGLLATLPDDADR